MAVFHYAQEGDSADTDLALLYAEDGFIEPSSAENSVALEALHDLDDEASALVGDLNADTQASTAMEALAQFIRHAQAHGGINRHMAVVTNCAFEAYCAGAKVAPQDAFALEALDDDPGAAASAAMEGISDKASVLWHNVKARVADISNRVGQKGQYLRMGLAELEARLAKIEAKAQKADFSQDAQLGYVKPRKSFIHLMYRSKGVPQKLAGVADDVCAALKHQSKIAQSTTQDYIKWIEQRYKALQTNPAQFNELHYEAKDWLPEGATVFDTKIERRVAVEGTVFYRSQELPGGQAIYAQVAEGKRSGADAITALGNVRYHLAPYDPTWYFKYKPIVVALAIVGIAVWIHFCVSAGAFAGALAGAVATGGNPLGAGVGWAAGVTAGALAGYHSGKYLADKALQTEGDTSKQELTVPQGLRLETLTQAEIKRAIADVRQGIKALEAWYHDTLGGIWRNRSLDRILQEVVMQDAHTAGTRAIKNYCFALLSAMDSHTKGLHVYALEVLFAMTDVIETSVSYYPRKA